MKAKKRIILLLTLILSINSFSQSFPENNPELLLQKTVKPKEISKNLQKYAYKNFFLEFNKEKNQFTKNKKKNKPFPSGHSYSPVSDYNKLVGKEFKVIEIFEITPKYSTSGKEYAIQIENPEIGKIFYNYNPKYKSSYELEVVGGLDYPKDFFCSKIKLQKDKFEDKETSFTPYLKGISFMKIKEKGNSSIYMNVRNNGRTLNVGKKGLNILFDNGQKLNKPEAKIDTKTSGGKGYIYSAFIKLNPTEIKLIIDNNITDTRTYIYDGAVDIESAKKIRAFLKCLSK